MFGRSKWCLMLPLDPFFGVPVEGKIPMPESQNCECPVMTSKTKNATAPLASGTVHEHAAVRVSSGRQREKAVPRHWHPTCSMLITVRSQNMCRTCLVLYVQNVFHALVERVDLLNPRLEPYPCELPSHHHPLFLPFFLSCLPFLGLRGEEVKQVSRMCGLHP